jgi:hypothetical protein
MYFDKVLWKKKSRIQNERWYQRETNKEISVLKKESKSLSRDHVVTQPTFKIEI